MFFSSITMNTNHIRIIILTMTIGYMYFILTKTITKSPVGVIHKPIQERSIKKKISDTIEEKVVTPKHYREMSNLHDKFINSLKTSNVKWENIIKLGDIYSTGVFPFLRPDDLCARQCYTVAAKCPEAHHAAMSVSKLINLINNPVERMDRQGDVIDPFYSSNISNIANKYINSLPSSAFTKSKNRYSSDTIYLPPHNPKRAPIVEAPPITTTIIIDQDKQNVHDHGVSSAIKTNINRLKTEFIDTPHLSSEGIVDSSMKICKDVMEKSKTDKNVTFTPDNLADAHRVIVSLTSDTYSTTGLTQIQILGRILQKIDEIGETQSNISDGIKETFAKRMASGVENGKLVCATGKISRALSIFEGVLEDSQKAVSMDVIRKEFGYLAENVRNEYLNSVGPSGRRAYETISSVPSYSEKMKDIFMGKVKKQYIDDMGMSPKIITPLANVYADSF